MNRSIRRALAGVITGIVTIAGSALLSAPMAHAATPYFTGTSACDVVSGNEVITYTVPNPLNTFTTRALTAVNTVYTKTGTATIFTSVPSTAYPTTLAGHTLTMTVPGNVAGTYRVNVTVEIDTATGPDWIVAIADAAVAGTCTVKPPEVLPTTITVSPSPTTASPTSAAPTTATPSAAAPSTAAPTSVAVTTSAAPTPRAVDVSAYGTSTASDGAVGGASLAATGSGVDEPAAILGIAALVVGGALVLRRRRS